VEFEEKGEIDQHKRGEKKERRNPERKAGVSYRQNLGHRNAPYSAGGHVRMKRGIENKKKELQKSRLKKGTSISRNGENLIKVRRGKKKVERTGGKKKYKKKDEKGGERQKIKLGGDKLNKNAPHIKSTGSSKNFKKGGKGKGKGLRGATKATNKNWLLAYKDTKNHSMK